MSDSVRPHRRQPTRLPCPWDSPGKNTGMGCHFLLQCRKVKVKSLSRVRLLATPWTAAHQAPLSMGFSRQESWSGVPLPSPYWVSAHPLSLHSSFKMTPLICCFKKKCNSFNHIFTGLSYRVEEGKHQRKGLWKQIWVSEVFKAIVEHKVWMKTAEVTPYKVCLPNSTYGVSKWKPGS